MMALKIANTYFEWGKRTYIMGILNVTPDSFSDGGNYYNVDTALQHVIEMIQARADIIDIGGESTRPGFIPVSNEEQINRVVPIIKAIRKESDIPISIDTYRAKTAEEALKAGANMVNDVWGLKYEPDMAKVIAAYEVPVCIMHNRATGNEYKNLIRDIIFDLEESIEIAHKAGIKDDKIIIDPGIGFAKNYEQNLEVIRQLDAFKVLGFPILLGASRKSFIGKILNLEVGDRLEGTLAVTAAGIMKGTDIVRVHDVLQNSRVAKTIDCLVRNNG